MSKIQEIIESLRKFYPDLEIIAWFKNNRGQLIVNQKVIFRFDPDYIEKQVSKFGIEGFNETVKIWAEYIETRYIQRKNRFDKKPNGRPGLGITASQVKFAMNNTKSNLAAARFLHISFNTYRKYAKIHGLFDQHLNPSAKGIPKGGHKTKVPFGEIFANKHINYNLANLKKRLVNEMILEERCEVCDYHERRAFDGKVGLLLDFKDGNKQNMSRDNIRLICFNCTFNIRGKLSKVVMRKIDEEYSANLVHEDAERVGDIWTELNPEQKEKEERYEPAIIQTNSSNDVEDIWNKFNK